MGCTQSRELGAVAEPQGSPSIVKEEHVELALRQKRRARNVFTESIELSKDFHKKVVAKDAATRELLGNCSEPALIIVL